MLLGVRSQRTENAGLEEDLCDANLNEAIEIGCLPLWVRMPLRRCDANTPTYTEVLLLQAASVDDLLKDGARAHLQHVHLVDSRGTPAVRAL